jgi:hypothetical protein
MAQVVKPQPSKCEALTSNPTTAQNKNANFDSLCLLLFGWLYFHKSETKKVVQIIFVCLNPSGLSYWNQFSGNTFHWSQCFSCPTQALTWGLENLPGWHSDGPFPLRVTLGHTSCFPFHVSRSQLDASHYKLPWDIICYLTCKWHEYSQPLFLFLAIERSLTRVQKDHFIL